MSIFSLSFRELLSPGTEQELDQLVGKISGYLREEHNDDGSHSNITATTLDAPEITTTDLIGPIDVDGRISIEQVAVHKTAVMSPSQLTGNQNNWNPADATDTLRGLDEITVIRIDTDAARTITGITAPAVISGTSDSHQPVLLLVNRGSYTITFSHNSSSSSAANRFECPGQVDFLLLARASVWIWYDTGSGVWRFAASPMVATLDHGTYTPTLTKVANLVAAVNAYQCQYMRVGNVVTVSGRFDAEPNAANTYTQMAMTLPITSDISTSQNLGGTAMGIRSTPNKEACSVEGDATNNRALFSWESKATSSHDFFFTFTYLVL